MEFHFPQKDEICESSERSRQPVIAVDLGFAGSKNKSCGLAWQEATGKRCQSKNANFGHCVKHTEEFLSENTNPVLIVEAPLSALFDSNGNPKGRLPFEKGEIGTTPRYWYTGAGASVGLGAIFFFSRLSEFLDPEPSQKVSVIEGFISFKERNIKHSEDALALLKAFRHPHEESLHEVTVGANERSINSLSFANLCSSEASCPVVLAVRV
jgi:hypothetical protein